MPTARHPAFSDVTVEIDEASIRDYLLSGWLVDQPKPEPAKKAAARRRTPKNPAAERVTKRHTSKGSPQ